jgi:hypothetical protein
MSTISDGTTTITPLLVLSPETSRDSRNVSHDVIGRDYPDVTLYPASLRTGTITFLCADEDASVEIENLHKAAAVITYVSSDNASMSMTYVPSGKIARTLDTGTLTRWLVAVDFQEVQP